jgi:hypothetical protein
MGVTSVKHLAVACLLRLHAAKATLAAKALLMRWPEPDRTDLIWFLKTDGLAVPDTSSAQK